MAFQEVKLNLNDLIRRAISSLGYVYRPNDNGGPNVFDPRNRPVCAFGSAKFHPDGHVCLFLKTPMGMRHVHAQIDLTEDEYYLLAGSDCDEEELH